MLCVVYDGLSSVIISICLSVSTGLHLSVLCVAYDGLSSVVMGSCVRFLAAVR